MALSRFSFSILIHYGGMKVSLIMESTQLNAFKGLNTTVQDSSRLKNYRFENGSDSSMCHIAAPRPVRRNSISVPQRKQPRNQPTKPDDPRHGNGLGEEKQAASGPIGVMAVPRACRDDGLRVTVNCPGRSPSVRVGLSAAVSISS
jgi:hypothetical protein